MDTMTQEVTVVNYKVVPYGLVYALKDSAGNFVQRRGAVWTFTTASNARKQITRLRSNNPSR